MLHMMPWSPGVRFTKALWFARCAMSYPEGTGHGKAIGAWLSLTLLDDLYYYQLAIGPPQILSPSSRSLSTLWEMLISYAGTRGHVQTVAITRDDFYYSFLKPCDTLYAEFCRQSISIYFFKRSGFESTYSLAPINLNLIMPGAIKRKM